MITHDWSAWGELAERYRAPSPRRILALDGGGIRGLITLALLEKLEADLADHYDREDLRLSQFFDYIGGTSTGAIIAAALAIGLSVPEVQSFYEEFGKEAFAKRKWYARWKSLYADGSLQKKLMDVYGEKTDLRPKMPRERPDPARKHLQSLLLAVTKNVTTDSAWPLSSNPSAKYNDTRRRDCNLQVPLWQLVRASTAAPVYFPPEVIKWDPNDEDKEFVFVDGGTTSYNCPAFLMARMATEPRYRLGWQRGEGELLVVSLGTGAIPVKGARAEEPETNAASAALNTLQGLMSQAMFDQDLSCRTVGRCTYGPELDREVRDLVPREGDEVIPLERDLGRAFLYARYNVELTEPGLAEIGIHDVAPEAVHSLDSTDYMDELMRIGQAAAGQISLSHLGAFIDVELGE